MAAVAHTAPGLVKQELDRIEATLASMQVWATLSRDLCAGWDDAERLRGVADRLEAVEDYWEALK